MSLLRLTDVHKRFEIKAGRTVHAVNGVSLDVQPGETLAIIGESGSGKSTLGRLALGLLAASSGRVEFDGHDLSTLPPSQLRRLRPRMQMVFQEPLQSLNPRMTVAETIAEPLLIHEPGLPRGARRERVEETLDEVGLAAGLAGAHPAALSGGQQQRVGVARAIVSRPRLVVLDEPTSSLDLSVRAQILNLLASLQQKLGLAYLLISHDIATVEYASARIAVMYLGMIVEAGAAATVIDEPLHPYTKALLSARLSTDPSAALQHVPLVGEIPEQTRLPSGCPLSGRCPIEIPACSAAPVPLEPAGPGREVACLKVLPRVPV